MSQEDRQVELRAQTEQLLQGSLKHVRAAALAAALVPLAAVALSPIVAQGQSSGGAPLTIVDVTNNPNVFRHPRASLAKARAASSWRRSMLRRVFRTISRWSTP